MTQNNAIWLLATVSNLTLFGCLILRRRMYRHMLIVQSVNIAIIAAQNYFHIVRHYENWAGFEGAEIFVQIMMLGFLNTYPSGVSLLASLPVLLSAALSAYEDKLYIDGRAVASSFAYYAACWMSILSDIIISVCVYHRLIGQTPKGEA